MLGGMQRTLSGLIMKFANQYLDKIDSDLNLSLWSGDVVLKGVELRIDVLQRLLGYDQHLRIDHAVIGELQIRIPWTSITTKSVEVKLSKLQIRLSIDRELSKPQDKPTTSPEVQDSAIDADLVEIESNNIDFAGQEGESNSWTKSLLERIVANAVLTIEDLSLTLSSPDHGCLQFAFASAVIRSTNAEWEAVQVSPPSPPWRLTHHLVSLLGIELSLKNECRRSNLQLATQTVLRGLDLDIRIRMYRTPSVRLVRRATFSGQISKAGPKLQADILALSPIEISISAEQIQMLLQMSQSIQPRSAKQSVDLANAPVFAPMEIVTSSGEPRKNSWGSWAWDLLAVPPDSNAMVDISEHMPSDVVTLSFQVPSVILHFYSLSFMFATLHARHLSLFVLHGISQHRLSISLQSLNFVDQSTLLPFLIVADDGDCKEFMPFLDIEIPVMDLSEHFRKSLERQGFDSDFVPLREQVHDYSNAFCLHSLANESNQCNIMFIQSASLFFSLKASSSAVLLDQFLKFFPLESTRKKRSDASVKDANSAFELILGNLCLTIHIEDMLDWNQDELSSNLNSLSFHISGVITEYGVQSRRLTCSSATLRMLSLALKANLFREVAPAPPSCFFVNNFTCEMAAQSSTYLFVFEKAQVAVCLNYIYLIIFSCIALADTIQYLFLIKELRSTLLGLRPTKKLCFFDAMFVNAVLSAKVIGFSASGRVPDAHKVTIMKLVIDISRRGQSRCLLATEVSPFVGVDISAKRNVSVNLSPAKLVWDSAFHDFIRLFQIYRRALQSCFMLNTSSGIEQKTSDGVRWKPSSLAVNISPVIISVPLHDAYHIRRLPTLLGYRSSPSLSFHLPSVSLSPLSLMLTDFSITDSNGNILLSPVSANATVTSSLSQASIDVGRIVVNMDVNQANAFKLALVALAPIAA